MKRILDIQNEYFEIIDHHFHDEILELKKLDFNRIGDFVDILKNKSFIAQTFPKTKTNLELKFERFLDDIENYWQKYEKEIVDFTNNSEHSSIVLWGNEPTSELLPKFLLYYDMVLIPDSFMSLGNNVIKAGFYRDAFIYFLIFDEIKGLLTTKTDHPLIIIVPYNKVLQESEKLNVESDLASNYINSFSGQIAIDAFKNATGITKDFNNEIELIEILKSESLLRLNANLNIEFIITLLNFIIENPTYLQMSKSKGTFDFIVSKRLFLKRMTLRDFYSLFTSISSIFAVFEARESNVINLNTTNLITKMHIPFADFKYKRVCKSFGSLLEIPNEQLINYTIKENFKWLTHIDISTTKLLREDGKLENFRKILRTESSRIKNVSFENFPDVANEFETNVLNELNTEHEKLEKDISEMKRKMKITGVSFAVTAGLTFSALAFPALLPLSIISSVYGLSAGSSVKDIYKDIVIGNGKLKELNKRPISIILNK